MKAWKQILQNTVTFDALTMYMLHAEYSVYSRQTLNEYITYQRGKTFASRRSNILKTGTWNVRYGETNIFYKNAIRENSGNVVRIDLMETRAAWTEISISIGLLRRLCQEQIYRFNHLFKCSVTWSKMKGRWKRAGSGAIIWVMLIPLLCLYVELKNVLNCLFKA